MIFWILTPVPPPHLGTPFFGGGGGLVVGVVKTSLHIVAAVCVYGPGYIFMDPLTHDWGPGSELKVPAMGPAHMAPRQ